MKFDQVGRRELARLIGAAMAAPALLAPRAAGAQPPAVPAVGFLHPASPDGWTDRLRGFRQGLKETGFVEGENLTIEYRWAENQVDRLPALAADLVRRRVAVIAATAPPSAFAARNATSTIPIVFTATEDPVRLGLVTSIARPDGNLTGVNFFSAEVGAKRLDLLRELVPGVARIAVLVNSTSPATGSTVRGVEAAARATGLQIEILDARNSREIFEAFATFLRQKPDALFVAGDAFFGSRRVQLANLASRHMVPATFALRDYVEAGGLMSYGASISDAYRQVGVYVGRILKGARPSDLPVVQASKFELVINAETARMLGISIPASLLTLADEIIE